MGPLTASEINALHEALDDEYRAWATYDQSIADFGEVPPFGNIRDAEARHLEALRGLFDRYGLSRPANPGPARSRATRASKSPARRGPPADVDVPITTDPEPAPKVK